ncbi:MAG: hypothetical protein L3J59_09340 [Methylococcaceae bacterium]|nr:hypothetical protein [Methylococcaceae bacterium]
MKHHRKKAIKNVFVIAGLTGLVISIAPLTAQFLSNEMSHQSSNHRHLDVNRFTKIGGDWPPQPKNMENIVWLQGNSGVRSNSISQVSALAKTIVINNVPELGNRFTFITSQTDSGKNGPSSEEVVTFFSHSNNMTVEVNVDHGEIKKVEEISPSTYQPPLTAEEVKEAVKIARKALQKEGFGRVQQLKGYGILAFKTSDEAGSDNGGFYDTRVVYVSFHEHIDARPEFIAWVDLTEGSVIKSMEDSL